MLYQPSQNYQTFQFSVILKQINCMEQLPPKPPITHNWASFPFHAAAVAPNSWMDEFLDFSATRRNVHRRAASDPITFVEESHNNNVGFDRLDDEQLRNMFSDDVVAFGSSSNPSSANPSTPSDQNSDDDQKIIGMPPELHHVMPKSEPAEVDCPPPPPKSSSDNGFGDNIADPKRVKRILANRQSAQRSRVRKLQYISELERSVSSLQTEVSALSPRVAFLDHQRLLLNVDNSALKQRIAALAQDKIFKDAHQEVLKREIERLRNIYHEQNMRKPEIDNDAPQPPFRKRSCVEEE